MPTKNDDLKARYATAEIEAAEAAEVHASSVQEKSRAILDGLLRKPLDTRFKAIEETGADLIGPHRRELMRSLQTAAPRKRTVAANTASRLEIWRSRLPYRVFPTVVTAISLVSILALVIMAYHRTSQYSVVVVGNEPVDAEWIGVDGEHAHAKIPLGNKYPLVRIDGDIAVLRNWVAGVGYEEIRVPVGSLRKTN